MADTKATLKKWSRLRFDPVRLFDLHVEDILLQDPYFVRASMGRYRGMGDDLFIALRDYAEVVGYLSEACPEDAAWLREGVTGVSARTAGEVRLAKARLLEESMPWNLGMAKCPAAWDALPWSYWDPSAIYDRVDLAGKTVLDVGAGTGQVTLRCAPYAELIYALEPVSRLRRYIERKMGAAGLENVRTLAGVLEAVPLEDGAVDVAVISNGSFGWNPDKELAELDRVTRPSGMILMLAPCNYGCEEIISKIRAAGYEEFEIEIPCDGVKPAFVKVR